MDNKFICYLVIFVGLYVVLSILFKKRDEKTSTKPRAIQEPTFTELNPLEEIGEKLAGIMTEYGKVYSDSVEVSDSECSCIITRTMDTFDRDVIIKILVKPGKNGGFLTEYFMYFGAVDYDDIQNFEKMYPLPTEIFAVMGWHWLSPVMAAINARREDGRYNMWLTKMAFSIDEEEITQILDELLSICKDPVVIEAVKSIDDLWN